MQTETRRTLLVFLGCVVAVAAVGAFWWVSGSPDPDEFVDRYAGWLVLTAVGSYLFLTIATHLWRMAKDPQYCPAAVESFMGTGLIVAGRAERKVQDDAQTCKSTLWVSVLFIPLVPIRSFVIRAPLDWWTFSPKPFEIIERIPLYRRHIALAVVGWLVAGGVAWLIVRGT